MTTYANHYSREKIASRFKIYQEVIKTLEYKREVNVFTLPSTNFLLESELVKIKGVDLTCVEKDPDVYKIAIKSSCTNEYYLGEAFDYLLSTNKVFDVIWLDFCCHLSLKIIHEFIYLIQGSKISDNATIAITIRSGREHEANFMHYIYQSENLEDFRKKGFPRIVIEAAKEANRECQLREMFCYNSNNHNSTIAMIMYLFNFKTTKNGTAKTSINQEKTIIY